MVAVLLAALTLQAPCARDGSALVAQASVRAAEFDLPGAADDLRRAVAAGCTTADVRALYVDGLVAARVAFSQGGSSESLEPVERAVAALDILARHTPGPAEIARLVLRAAAAAAQSERDEMRVYLDAAVRMEMLQRAAAQPGAPVVSAVETAGDLWLQVHRYEDAHRAYLEAETAVGPTPRNLVGLARTAVRLNDEMAACANYRRLMAAWGSRAAEPPEIAEGRMYLEEPFCGAAGP